MKKHRIKIGMILIMGLQLSGCQFLREQLAQLKTKIGGKKTSESTPELAKTQNAQMVEAKLGDIVDQIETRGKFEASERAEIRSDKRIRIGPALVKRYASVKRGQVLFEVDTKELVQKRQETKERLEQLNLDLNSAKSQAQFAKRNHDRKAKLAEKGIVPQRELDEAAKQLTDASNQLKTKQLELRKATRDYEQASKQVTGSSFLSPMNGIVQSIHLGATDVNAGDTIATIVDPTKLAIYIVADEATASRMPKGFKLSVIPDSATNEKLMGEVKMVSLTPGNGGTVSQYEVKIEVKESDIQRLKLMAGFDASVKAEFARRSKVTTIPVAAIRMNGAESFSSVSNSKTMAGNLRAIKLGLRTKLEAEVISGIKPGQYVDISSRDELAR